MTIGAVVAGVGYALGTTSLPMLAVSVVGSVISHVAQARAASKAAYDAAVAANASKGMQVVTEGEIAGIPIVYGRAKVGGTRTVHYVKSNIVDPGVLTPNTIVFPSSGRRTMVAPFAPHVPAANVRIVYYLKADINGPIMDGNGLQMIVPWPEHEDPYIFSYWTKVIEDFPNDGVIHYLGPGSTSYRLHVSNHDLRKTAQYTNVLVDHVHFALDSNGQIPTSTRMYTYYINGGGYDAYGEYVILTGPDLATQGYGNITFSGGRMGTKKQNNSYANCALFFKQVLCYEGINDVVYMEIDDQPYNLPQMDARCHILTTGGSGESWIQTNFPTEEANSMYHGVCHATFMCWLDRDKPQYSGIPKVTFIVEGMKIHGLAMTGWLDESNNFTNTYFTPKTYSNNSALVLLDYLVNPHYGKGLADSELDLESFYLASKLCERLQRVNNIEEIPAEGDYWLEKAWGGKVRTQAIFETNIVLDSKNSVLDNIKLLLEPMGDADLIWSEGRYRLQLNYVTEWSSTYNSSSLGHQRYAEWLYYQYPGTDIFVVRDDATRYYKRYERVIWPSIGHVDADIYTNVWPSEYPRITEDPRDANGNLDHYWKCNNIGSGLPAGYFGLTAAYITDDVIISGSEISQSWAVASDKLNFLTVMFNNEAINFKEDSVAWPWKESSIYATYLAEDNGVALENTRFLNGVTSLYSALAMAAFIVRKSRAFCTYKFTIPKQFIYLDPGDLIKLSSETLGIVSEFIKITSIVGNAEQNLEIEGTRFDPRIQPEGIHEYELVTPREYLDDIIGQADNLVFTASTSSNVLSAGTLTWDAAEDARVVGYDIKLLYDKPSAVTANTVWTDIGYTTGTSIVFPPMKGVAATLAVVAKTANGGTAPEFNIVLGSRWPLCYVDLIESLPKPIVALVPNTISIPPNSSGIPDVTGLGGRVSIELQGISVILDASFEITISVATTGCSVALDSVPANKGKFNVTAITQSTASAVFTVVVSGQTSTLTLPINYTGSFFNPSNEGASTPSPVGCSVSESPGGVLLISHSDPTSSFLFSNEVGETRYKNGGYQHTKGYIAKRTGSVPLFSDATLRFTLSSTQFSYPVERSSDYYVWLTWVAVNGVESAPTAVTHIVTSAATTEIKTALEGALTVDELSAPLVTWIQAQGGSFNAAALANLTYNAPGTFLDSSRFLFANDNTTIGCGIYSGLINDIKYKLLISPGNNSIPAPTDKLIFTSNGGVSKNTSLADLRTSVMELDITTIFASSTFNSPVAGVYGFASFSHNFKTAPVRVNFSISVTVDNNSAVVSGGNLTIILYEGTTSIDSYPISYKSSYNAFIGITCPGGGSAGVRTFRIAHTLPVVTSGSIVVSNAKISMVIQY